VPHHGWDAAPGNRKRWVIDWSPRVISFSANCDLFALSYLCSDARREVQHEEVVVADGSELNDYDMYSCWFLDNIVFNGLMLFVDYFDVIVIVRTC
jgi:hypothetical protein